MKLWYATVALVVMFSGHGAAASQGPNTAGAWPNWDTSYGRTKVGSRTTTSPDKAWRLHQSRHFTLFYDTSPQRASAQATLLETTYRHFFRTFTQAGFELSPPSRRLTCLCFGNRQRYLDYARRVDGVNMSWTVAYYSARTNDIAFFPYHATPPDAPAVSPTADDRASRHLYGNAENDTAGPRLRARHVTMASTTHEAAHQLAFNSGLQKRGVMYPLWVCEGLATNFEVMSRGQAFGPSRDNPDRRRRLLRTWRAGHLQPLDRFVTRIHPDTDDPVRNDALYAQSWGLFHYLFLTHPRQLADYFARLKRLPTGPRGQTTLRGEFVKSFGSLAKIQRQWRTWITKEAGK